MWVIVVCAYAAFEYSVGPDSAMVFIEMITSKTHEPISVLKGNEFAGFVPVEPRLIWPRLVAATIGPVVAAWVLVYLSVITVRWIVAGFKRK